MKAMILAAGFGTRLGEIGTKVPKCLIEVGHQPMLAHVTERLKQIGVEYLVVNTHHLAPLVLNFLDHVNQFGIEVAVSHEVEILGTGGGVLKARQYLEDQELFLVHNADIYTDYPLERLVAFHTEHKPIASLLVMRRDTHRRLLVDEGGALLGWENTETGKGRRARKAEKELPVAFTGIQVVSPELFRYLEREDPPSSIITAYLHAAEDGKPPLVCDLGDYYWKDMGTPERLRELRAHVEGETTPFTSKGH